MVLSEMDPFRIVDIPKVSLVFSLPGRRRAGNHYILIKILDISLNSLTFGDFSIILVKM